MLPLTHEDVTSVLSLIEETDLRHPSEPLLRCFVTDAVDPIAAARYVRGRLSAGEGPSLVSDWTYIISALLEHGTPPPTPDANSRAAISKRDGGKCCITGKSGTLRDPLVVAPILPCPSGWLTGNDRIMDVLGVFFGPSYRDWWLSFARNPQRMPPCRNHWLVRQSAARAYAQGLVKLVRLQPSMIEYLVKEVSIGFHNPIEVDGQYPLLGDHSRSGIETVDPRFVGTHARLCRSLQYTELAKEIAPDILHSTMRTAAIHPMPPGAPPARRWKWFSLWNLFPSRLFRAIWLLFPSRMRIAAYDMLLKLGQRKYNRVGTVQRVQRVPFGLYIRSRGNPDRCRNEFNALQMVQKYTSIPVPKPLDLVIKEPSGTGAASRPQAYLVMTRLSGAPIALCEDILSDDDCRHIAAQLKDYLAQLRAIPKTVNPDMAICNTLGEACSEPRIRDWQPIGPFRDEAAFSAMMRFPDDPARRGHKIVFTHADLNARNILIDRAVHADGRLGWGVSGIVDWETAGFYPEYWDYTKAMFEGFRWTRRYVNMVKDVFSALGDYSKELNVETESWALADGI
ncbi:hypothetical protein PYCCODRAFT_1393643 [Trametes coccinea BRFM310]|uniref:Aminoglycoside phosphotransferase domain-containing protein n=1 Tax=Trametes coccinea (strain BRFM310) TaxID=1353009 RepID=A0A1Y2IGW2_TRAC3|nr:hypothetical protein PYCCODRAFT_1393643 [Trametes coccinea BRFM310]